MNPHSVLGVASGATPEEIKSAYRKLAMTHHPDRNGGTDEAARKFQEIQSAYDMLRQDKPKNQGNPQPNMHANMHMHDVFDHFFNRQRSGNPTLQAHCQISLEQAFSGCTVSFNINGRTVAVDLPAGIDSGQMVTVSGAAGQPDPNYPAGDLHVGVIMQPHARFQRHGMTLLTRVKIGLLDLITGCEMTVQSLTGETLKLTVPENSAPTSVLTIKGQGMPVVNSPQRGDLAVAFEVEYPSFTPQQLKTLRKMKA